MIPLVIMCLLDLTGVVQLWGERLLRRYVHHIQNVNCYQPWSRKALLVPLPQLLGEKEMAQLNDIDRRDRVFD